MNDVAAAHDDVRAIRDEIAKAHDYDVRRIAAWAQSAEADLGALARDRPRKGGKRKDRPGPGRMASEAAPTVAADGAPRRS